MKTTVIRENPIFAVSKPYTEDDFELYASDIKDAPIGFKWETHNQDCYPNCTCEWAESFEIIYKTKNGAAVLYRSEEAESFDYYHELEIELIWVELH